MTVHDCSGLLFLSVPLCPSTGFAMSRLLLRSFCLALLAASMTLPAAAVDRVIRIGGGEDAGEVTAMDSNTVTLKSRTRGESSIPTNEIDYIDFDAAPPTLGAGRSAVDAGNLERAIDALGKAKTATPDNENVLKEIDYLLAVAALQEAGRDEAKRAAAIEQMQSASDGLRKHYRYYPALLKLAEAQAAAGQYPQAKATYKIAGDTPHKNIKLAADVGRGRAELAGNNTADAETLFRGVVAQAGDTPGEKSQKLAAQLGLARVQLSKQQYDEAIAALDAVIRDSTIDDAAVQAEAYLRQGDAYAAKGGAAKNAILAYLHVDVVPALAKESSIHAEALYRLSQMWPLVAKPDRASESAGRLQQLYPASEWATKL